MDIVRLVKTVDVLDMRDVFIISTYVNKRIDKLEDLEPDSDGQVRDDWEEKMEELVNIKEYCDILVDQMDCSAEESDELIDLVLEYQSCYGCLKRI